MSKKTKKIMLATSTTLIGASPLLMLGASSTASSNEEASNFKSSFFRFYNAYDYFNSNNIKNEVYGYGVYDGFSDLVARYDLRSISEKPYNDTRTYVGTTKPINGSAYASGANGDANLLEKGFSAMGIKLASKPEGRYAQNNESVFVNPNNEVFTTLANNILAELVNLENEISNNETLLEKFKDDKSLTKEEAFLKDIYQTIRGKSQRVASNRASLQSKSIDYSQYVLGKDYVILPTYKAFNFETETKAWIQSFIFTLKAFDVGYIDNANGTVGGKKGSFNTLQKAFSEIWKADDFFTFKGILRRALSINPIFITSQTLVKKYGKTATKASGENEMMIFMNDKYADTNFQRRAPHIVLNNIFGVISSTAKKNQNDTEASPFMMMVKSSNPIVVDYSPSFMSEIFTLLNGVASTSDTNSNVGSYEVSTIATEIANYIQKQTGVSGNDINTIYLLNKASFGNVLDGVLVDNQINIQRLKQNLLNTKLTAKSTRINSQSDIIRELKTSRDKLNQNFEAKMATMSDYEKDALKFDYFNSTLNKINTNNVMFNYLPQNEITLENKDDYTMYKNLKSKENLTDEERVKLTNLEIKFSDKIQKVSLKTFLKNIAILHNLNSEENIALIDNLEDSINYTKLWTLLQTLYGVEERYQVLQIPSSIDDFEGEIYLKLENLRGTINDLITFTKENFDNSNSIEKNTIELLNGYKKQQNTYQDILSAIEMFKSLLTSLDIENENIKTKIRDINVAQINVENNLSMMFFNALNGFNTATYTITSNYLKQAVKKGPGEVSAADRYYQIGKWTGNVLNAAGSSLMNLLSLNFGGIYQEWKDMVRDSKNADEVALSKGLTLSAFLTMQNEMTFLNMVQKSVYLGQIANTILYLSSFLESNDFNSLRNNADFAALYGIFMLGVENKASLTTQEAPDYLVATFMESLVKGFRSILEKDNERNALIQADEYDTNDLSFLGSYVAQSAALLYNYNKALGKESDDEVSKLFKEYNQIYYAPEIETAGDELNDFEKSLKANIFNVLGINRNLSSISDIFNDFKTRIITATNVFDASVIKQDYENSSLWNKLANYEANKSYFDNLSSEDLTNEIKETFLNTDNEDVVKLFEESITIYLRNVSFIVDNKDKTEVNILPSSNSLKTNQDKLFNLVNGFFKNNLEVVSLYATKFTEYYNSPTVKNQISRASTTGVNISEAMLNNWVSQIQGNFYNRYEDEDYLLGIVNQLTLSYTPNFTNDYSIDLEGLIESDRDTASYLERSDNAFIQDISNVITKDNVSKYRYLANTPSSDFGRNLLNVVKEYNLNKGYTLYRASAIPIYSRFKYGKGNWFEIFKRQLISKEAHKLASLTKQRGAFMEATKLRAMLEAGDVKGIQSALEASGKVKFKESPITFLKSKFKKNYIFKNAEDIAAKAVSRVSELQNFGKSTGVVKLNSLKPDQMFAFVTRTKANNATKYIDGTSELWNVFKKSVNSDITRRGEAFGKFFGVGEASTKLDDIWKASQADTKVAKLIQKKAATLQKIQASKKLTDAQKAAKTTKIMNKLAKNRKILVLLNGKKAVRLAKLAKIAAFGKKALKLLKGVFANPYTLIISVAIDSVINFLTFDTEKQAGYWLPLNSAEIDNIHTEVDYNNTSEGITNKFNYVNLLNPVKVKNADYINIAYIKELATNDSFLITEAMRMLGENDEVKFTTRGSNEYIFKHYLKQNALNMLLALDKKNSYDNQISSHSFRNNAIYLDNQNKNLSSVPFDSASETRNFANVINRTNIIDLNVNYKEFISNPFTDYLDFSALNNINNQMFVKASNQNIYGAYGSYVKLPISDLINTGLSSLVFIGNEAKNSFVSDNSDLGNLLENTPVYSKLTNKFNVSTQGQKLNSAERATNKNARWYSLIPFIGSIIAENQRDGKTAFKLDKAPVITSMPYLPTNLVHQVLNTLNGSGGEKQSLFGYSMISLKLVRMNNGHLGLKVVQTIYDNSSVAYSYANENLRYKYFNTFNGALLYNQKELHKDIFIDAISKVEDVISDENSFGRLYLDVNDNFTLGSNLENMSLENVANKELVLSYDKPTLSKNFLIASYAKRIENRAREAVINASMPHSFITGNVLNKQLNAYQKELLKKVSVSKLEILPYYDSKKNLKFKIRFDLTFDDIIFNKKSSPIVSFFVNNRIYKNLGNTQDFFNTVSDIDKLKPIIIKENNRSKLKEILKNSLKIKEYSSFNQSSYDLLDIYENSFEVDEEELKKLEREYLAKLEKEEKQRLEDLKFNYLKDAFVASFIESENFDKEYSQAANRQEVLNRYYEKLLIEERLIVENRIKYTLFNTPSAKEHYTSLYELNENLITSEDKIKFLAMELDKIYYNKKIYNTYEDLEAEFSKSDYSFNVNLTNPFSFEVFTNKHIKLDNGSYIEFTNNFQNQKYKNINVKNNKVMFAFDLNKFDDGERIYYNEYGSHTVQTPYVLTYVLVDDDNIKKTITINFQLPNLKYGDVSFKQNLDSDLRDLYSAKYINVKMLPFIKNTNNLNLDDIQTIIRQGNINLAFGDDKDKLARDYLGSTLYNENDAERAKALQEFDNLANLGDNSRFLSFIVANPFRVFTSKNDKETSVITRTYNLKAKGAIPVYWTSSYGSEYLNNDLPFHSIDVSYLFDNSKLLEIENLPIGTEISYFKTDNGNIPSSVVRRVNINHNSPITIDFSTLGNDYNGLYKLCFLVPIDTTGKNFYKYNKLVYLSPNNASQIINIKNEINAFLNPQGHYLLELEDTKEYHQLLPFIRKTNTKDENINALTFSTIYRDYIYSNNKYIVASIKYKSINDKTKELLSNINNTLEDTEINKPFDLETYLTSFKNTRDKYIKEIEALKKQNSLNKLQILQLSNLLKNINDKIEVLTLRKEKLMKVLNNLNTNNEAYLSLERREITNLLNIQNSTFKKLKMREWLYKKQLENKLIINSQTLDKYIEYLNNGDDNFPTDLPTEANNTDTFNIQDILSAKEALASYNEYERIKEEKNKLLNEVDVILRSFDYEENLLDIFIESELNFEKAKSFHNDLESATLTTESEKNKHFEDNTKISEVEIVYFDFASKSYKKVSSNQNNENISSDSLDKYLVYKYHESEVNKMYYLPLYKTDVVNLTRYVKVNIPTEGEKTLEWRTFSGKSGDILVKDNTANFDTNYEVRENLTFILRTYGIDISYLNKEVSYSYANKAEIKAKLENLKTLINNNFSTEEDIYASFKNYFDILNTSISYDETINNKKLTLLSAYDIIKSQLTTSFEEIIRNEIIAINDTVEEYQNNNFLESINDLQRATEITQREINKLLVKDKLKLQIWWESLLFSKDYGITLSDYLSNVNNQSFNSNEEYLDFIINYLSDKDIPILIDIANYHKKIEFLIKTLYTIDNNILIGATSNIEALSYVFSKLSPMLSNTRDVKLSQVMEMLGITTLAEDFAFKDYNVRGFINLVNTYEPHPSFILQLHLSSSDRLINKVMMMKIEYDSDIKYYILDDTSTSETLNLEDGEWNKTLIYNDELASTYANVSDNSNYVLRHEEIINKLEIKDNGEILNNKWIKNHILEDLSLFTSNLTIKQFNLLFDNVIINDLGEYSFLNNVLFDISQRDILEDDFAKIVEFTLKNTQYTVIINVVMNKTTNNSYLDKQFYLIYDNNNLEAPLTKGVDVNSILYENNKDISLNKDISKLVKINDKTDALSLIEPIISGDKTSVLLSATELKEFLAKNNLHFSSNLSDDSFFKELDLINSQGDFKNHLYEISLAHNNPDIDIVKNQSLAISLYNLKLTIFSEFATPYTFSPFIIAYGDNINKYDKLINNTPTSLSVENNDDTLYSLNNYIQEVANEVNKTRLKYQSKYINSDLFISNRMKNLKSALYYALVSYKYINPTLSRINNLNNSLESKVDYLYQYVINHYNLPTFTEDNFDELVNFLIENYLFSSVMFEDEYNENGEVVKKYPVMVENIVSKATKGAFDKTLNLREISFNLSFEDREDSIKRESLEANKVLYAEDNITVIENPFKKYNLEYNGTKKYINFSLVKENDTLKVVLTTSKEPLDFNLENLILEEEKSLDRDVINKLINERLILIEKELNNLVDLEKTSLTFNPTTNKITKSSDDYTDFNLRIISKYHKDISKTTLNKDNMFIPKALINNVSEEDKQKLLSDKEFILSFVNISVNSYLYLIPKEDITLRLFDVIDNEDFISYIYEVKYKNDKLENTKIQLNFNKDNLLSEIAKGTKNSDTFINEDNKIVHNVDEKETDVLSNKEFKFINPLTFNSNILGEYSLGEINVDEILNPTPKVEEAPKELSTSSKLVLGFLGIITVGSFLVLYGIYKRAKSKRNFAG